MTDVRSSSPHARPLPRSVDGRRRGARARGRALLAVGLLAGLLVPVAGPAGQAQALTCKQNQRFKVAGKLYDYVESWRYSSGGRPTLVSSKTYSYDAGYTELGMAACKSGSTWVLVSPISNTPHYNGLQSAGSTRKKDLVLASGRVRGFGTPVLRVTTKAVTVKPFECKKSEAPAIFRVVTGLPIPLEKQWMSVAAWFASTATPDLPLRCYEHKAPAIKVSVGTSGTVYITGRATTGRYVVSSTPLGEITLVHHAETVVTTTRL